MNCGASVKRYSNASKLRERKSEAKVVLQTTVEAARKQGVPGADKMSAEDARKLQEQMKQMGQSAGETLHVPRANVQLFRKHEAELKKYAMNGLAFLGL